MNFQSLIPYLMSFNPFQMMGAGLPMGGNLPVPGTAFSFPFSASPISSPPNIPPTSINTTDTSLPEVSGGKPMISSINGYRTLAGLPLQNWDGQLAANAHKTGQASGGMFLAHQMNRGTAGQVLTMGVDDEGACGRSMGGYTPFEIVYYSWLCEVPNDPALQGRCPEILRISRIMSMGQTGHHTILAGKGYKRIGCAFAKNQGARGCGFATGVWACDVGYWGVLITGKWASVVRRVEVRLWQKFSRTMNMINPVMVVSRCHHFLTRPSHLIFSPKWVT